jgi:hypothetical protein
MSPERPIDDELRRFVVASVPSVAHLEAVLLFRRRASTRTIAEAALELYISERAAAEVLRALVDTGVLSHEGDAFGYAPRDARMAALLDRLAEAYAADLVLVTNLIHDRTHRNARRFADAFKLRKDD